MAAEDWRRVALGEVVSFQLGKMLDGKRQTGERVRSYIRAANVSSWGHLDLTDLRVMDFSESEDERFTVEKGDLIICEGGDAGRCTVYYGDERLYFQKALYRGRVSESVSAEFVRYQLEYLSQAGLLDQYCTTTTIKHLSSPALRAVELRLPGEEEQRRIVDLLSATDRLVDALGDEVAAASLSRSELVIKLLSGAQSRVAIDSVLTEHKDQLSIDNDTLYTQVTVSGGGRGMRLRERKYGRDIGTKRQRCIAADTLIVSKLGAADGACCVVPIEFEGAVVTQDFPTFSLDLLQADPVFLDIVVRSLAFARQCASITNGTGQGRVDMKRFGGLEIPLPGLEEQRRTVSLVAAADAMLQATKDKASAARQLRDQLLHDLLSGKHTIPESYDRFLAEVPS